MSVIVMRCGKSCEKIILNESSSPYSINSIVLGPPSGGAERKKAPKLNLNSRKSNRFSQ